MLPEDNLFPDEKNSMPNPNRFSMQQPPSPKETARLSSLPEYLELIENYQQGNWQKCDALLHVLLQSYPDDSELLIFKKDIETKTLLHHLNSTEESEKKKFNIRKSAYLSAALFVLVLIIGYMLFSFFKIQQEKIALANEQTQMENLKSMESQARQLMQGERSDEAIKIIEEMMTSNPEYPGINDLYQEAVILSKLESMYAQAVQLVQAGEDDEALELFKEIDQLRPFYRDVKYQETLIENRDKIVLLKEEGQKAYEEQRWDVFINSYDEIIEIDPQENTTEIKEQYLNAYLNTILSMLNSPETTIEDVDLAETYYRKALALFPQSKQYAEERENLQKLSRKLLVLKYAQMAKEIINSPTATMDSINVSLRYLAKAISLDPGNSQIMGELDKAQMFRSSLQYFNSANPEMTISQLSSLIELDPTYGEGKTNQMVYESYSIMGKQLFDMGIYLDARVNYEAAENIAFGQTKNLLQLYEVQLNLGYTLGGLRNYKDAVSYFKYAFEATNISARLDNNPEIAQMIKDAESQYNAGNFLESYTLYTETITAMSEAGIPFTMQEIDVEAGTSLVFVASAYNSTIQAIQEQNDLPGVLLLKSGETLIVPTIK